MENTMNYIKNILSYMILASCYQLASSDKSSPEFDRLMHDFSKNIEKFVQVFHHGTQQEKKGLSKISMQGIQSAYELHTYIKKHPHEKRFVSQQQRKALEKKLYSLPRVTNQQVTNYQKDAKKINEAIADFLGSSRSMTALSKKDSKYKQAVITCVTRLQDLEKLIAQHPGHMVNNSTKQELIKAVKNLKNIFPPVSSKHDGQKAHHPATKNVMKKDTTSKPLPQQSGAQPQSQTKTSSEQGNNHKVSTTNTKKESEHVQKQDVAKKKEQVVKQVKKIIMAHEKPVEQVPVATAKPAVIAPVSSVKK